MIKEGSLTTQHVPSHGQLADVLTKILPVQQHNDLLLKLGVISQSASHLEGGVMKGNLIISQASLHSKIGHLLTAFNDCTWQLMEDQPRC